MELQSTSRLTFSDLVIFIVFSHFALYYSYLLNIIALEHIYQITLISRTNGVLFKKMHELCKYSRFSDRKPVTIAENKKTDINKYLLIITED